MKQNTACTYNTQLAQLVPRAILDNLVILCTIYFHALKGAQALFFQM